MHDWERSTDRTISGGRVDAAELATGDNGRSLCRWCQLEIPPGRRRTFCSDFCVTEWRLRSDPAFLRDKVFERDRGVCAQCGIDTVAAFNELRRSRKGSRLRLLSRWGLTRLHRRSLWDADHVIPVAEGGGACDLSNLRTLCLVCHRAATAELRARLARAADRQQP